MKMLQRNSQTVKFIIFKGAQPNPTGDKTKPLTIMIYMSGSKKKFQTLWSVFCFCQVKLSTFSSVNGIGGVFFIGKLT